MHTSSGDIYYCPLFFTEVPLSYLCNGRTTVNNRDTAPSNMLHMLAGSVANTEEHEYGCPKDRTLAASSPSLAMRNSDTYGCFAAEVYVLVQC